MIWFMRKFIWDFYNNRNSLFNKFHDVCFNRPYKHPPLFNMEFVLVGELGMSQYEIEGMIRKMGGKVVSVIHDKLTAVISNQREVQRMGFEMKQAKKCNIQVISDEFLTEITTTDPMLYIISKSLADWGGDVCIDSFSIIFDHHSITQTSCIDLKLFYFSRLLAQNKAMQF